MKIIGQIPRWLAFLLMSLSGLTETIYTTSLPKIAAQLNTYGSIAQGSSTAYYLGFALGIFTLGRVSDLYGRRPVVLFGISFYLLVTLALSQVSSIDYFIILRFLQAYGASVGSVVVQAMVRDSYKGWQLSYMFAFASLIVSSIVPSLGSLLGGYLSSRYEDWQYIFYFLSLLSSVMLVIYAIFLPETNPYIGAVSGESFWRLFIEIVRDKYVVIYAFIVGSYHGINLSFYLQAPFIFIERLHMNLDDYGKPFLLLTVASLCGGLTSMTLVKRLISVTNVKKIGFSLSLIGAVLMNIAVHLILPENNNILTNIMWIFGSFAFYIMGHSMLIPMLLRVALENYTKNSGSAGSIFGAIYYCVASLVTFIIATLHSSDMNNYAHLLAVICFSSCFIFAFLHRPRTTIL